MIDLAIAPAPTSVDLTAWARAFALTCAFELPIVLLATRESPTPVVRRAAIAFTAQLLTHPLVWFVFPRWTAHPEAAFALSELSAWWLEALLYTLTLAKVSPWLALGVSGVANAVTLGLGLLL